jgi:nicotinamide-nucleotide amidase
MANAEILCIGTELLLGQVLNTNAHYLSEQLAELGLNCYYHTTVGDNLERMKDSLHCALNRSDVVVITGGLGPTPDDLTHEMLADFFQVELRLDDDVLARIQRFFDQRGVPMAESNKKQAFRPTGADKMNNPRGTAPGLVWSLLPPLLAQAGIERPEEERVILTFPGVPSEMKSIWEETARPLLEKRFGPGVVWSCELKHYGIGESALAEKYSHLMASKNPTVAPYAGVGECRLRVTARATTVDEAQAMAHPAIEEIKRDSKFLYYGENQDTLESVVGKLLVQAKKTVSIAESCTGGLVSKRLTDVPGSSRYVSLNVVTYSNEAKAGVLKIPKETLDKHGSVSQEAAKAMSEGVQLLSGADIGLAITGIAGPDGGSEEKPVGLVYIGIATDEFTTVRRYNYPSHLSRLEIRQRTSSDALNLLRQYLLDPEAVNPPALKMDG